MIFEMFIHSLHPIPYLDFKITLTALGSSITYRFQTFMYALMYLKIYSILRVIAEYTKYSNTLTEKIW